MGSLAEVLLQKTVQGKPLRSTLNGNYTDFKTLEFEIRKKILSPRNLSSQNLVNDHYVRIQGVSGAYGDLAIPPKHIRSDSQRKFKTSHSRLKSRSSHRPTDADGLSSRPTTAHLLESHEVTTTRANGPYTTRASGLHACKTFSFLPETSRPTSPGFRTERAASSRPRSSRLENEIGEACLAARRGVKREKRQVRRLKKKCAKSFKACAKKLDAALQADIIGFVPKALQDLQARKGPGKTRPPMIFIPSTAKTHALSLEKEIVRDYRKSLASKAFARGMDRDLRYIYTFGSLTPLK